MPKAKIFDIIPPSEEIKEKPTFEKKLEKPVERIPQKKPSPFWQKPLLIVGGLASVALLSYILIEPKAEIEVWPETETGSFKTQVTVLSSIFIPDFTEFQLPGEKIQTENVASREFSSTGTKSKSIKARGTITVYNAYTTSPQTFVAKTRFVSSDGKLFRAPQRIIVPGAHYEGGKLVPGEVAAEVEADQPGEEYNIGSTTFSIPGLAGTASYTTIYAKSFEPMTGGATEKTSQVTQEDLDKAEEILTAEALSGSRQALEKVLPSQDYVLVVGATSEKIIDIIPLAEKGQEVDKFLFQVKAASQALVFKESDLKELAKFYLESQIPAGKNWQENSLAFSYSVESLDLAAGEIVLNLDVSAKIYSMVDENSLKESVKNKKPDEIKKVIGQIAGVERFQIELWPFWVKASSEDVERITIKLRLD